MCTYRKCLGFHRLHQGNQVPYHIPRGRGGGSKKEGRVMRPECNVYLPQVSWVSSSPSGQSGSLSHTQRRGGGVSKKEGRVMRPECNVYLPQVSWVSSSPSGQSGSSSHTQMLGIHAPLPHRKPGHSWLSAI